MALCRSPDEKAVNLFPDLGIYLFERLLLSHPLIHSLRSLRGNARGCVYTEPLWGIPFNLYAPYVSVYMLAMGLSDVQIGSLVSIGLALQIVTALMSGVITDKLGRKRATLIFDLLSWSVPTLIWAVAQDYRYFLVAAIVNSLWRITMNSWSCLMVEDTDPKLLVDIYTWIYIAGLLSAFFAPVAGLLINAFTLVPTMRGLYLLAFLMMTTKFLVMNALVKETRQGQVRMAESKQQSIIDLLREYTGVIRHILAAPQTLFTLGIMLVMSITQMVHGTFWSIYVTEKLQIPTQHLALYPFARSVVMLLFFFTVMPRLRELNPRHPMLLGFGSFVLSQLLLILAPDKSYIMVLMSTFLEACSIATVSIMLDRRIVVTVDAAERARIQAVMYVVVIVFTSPFGWVAGNLSQLDRTLPFALNIGLFAVGAILAHHASRLPELITHAAHPVEVESL
jgi:MFS family permease